MTTTIALTTPGWRAVRLLAMAAGLFAAACAPAVAAPDSAGVEFFEKHIRPVLIENCYSCHSPQAEKGIKGGLSLDTRDGLLKGGDSGPVIVPGDPERSLLIKAVRYTDADLKMPPKDKKLSDEAIEHLTAWVKMGAPDPRTGQPVAAKSASQAAQHWAFQPVKEPSLPPVRNKRLAQTGVDHFLLARLEAAGLTYSPRADKRTLIRRVTYDLTGLPPTPEEMAAFERDASPGAFSNVVERLLASPRHGERWGRHWLDVARYADTKGYVFEEERRYPYSYTYRDWVIRAFNEDLPYDQFLQQQIAADLLPLGDDKRPLAALGFLTLGRRFLNNQPDIIDDRLDVVFRGTMGLTLACARCHDHKYDPIPIQDYYSLYGVFAGTHEPGDKPLLGSQSLPKSYDAYLAERKKRVEEKERYLREETDKLLAKVRAQGGDYLLVVQDSRVAEDKLESLARERKLRTPFARRVREQYDDFKKNPVFAPWFAYAALPGTNFAAQAQELSARLTTNAANALVAARFTAVFSPTNLVEVAAAYNALFADVDKEWRELSKATNAPKSFADADKEAVRQVLHAEDGAFRVPSDSLRGVFDTPVQQHLRALQRKIDGLDAEHDGAPPRAMALFDNEKPARPRVFKRGNPNVPGDEVPRQFLQVLAGPDRKPFTRGSGRLEMAEAIAGPRNPLTARVWVNRVWAYHFGTPLVATPGDFGLRSEPPTHPELLDWLAARFMAGGWSTKQLHRMILLSTAYQQSSLSDSAADGPGARPASAAVRKATTIDPGNQLLWRQNRRRLDLEALRDTLLHASGRLDPTMGGRPVDITGDNPAPRRTVYGFVERQNLPGLFRTFDFASPDTSSAQRFTTTVPQQALFLMNSPFVVAQARAMVQRPDVAALPTDAGKLRRLHQIALQREPAADELKLAEEFLATQSALETPAEPPAWQYGFGAFDAAAGRVNAFTPLPHFNNYSWQGGPELPDPKLNWCVLNAEGGHPGNCPELAVIRRWRAPRDGAVSLQAELHHPAQAGDGVRARVVSSRLGVLGDWTAHHGRTPTSLDRVEVRRGDLLDFVTDCRAGENSDSFQWAPVIRYLARPAAAAPDARMEWSAQADFSGPAKEKERRALTPWEKYAQVLLLANELVFVD